MRCRSQVLRHGFLFGRSLRQGDNTGVDLVCSYRKEPSSPDLDRVGLYHEVSNKTRAVTRLGPYSLDRTSLYVNGEQGLSCCLPLALRLPPTELQLMSLSLSLSLSFQVTTNSQ